MKGVDILILLVIAVIVGVAIWYVYKSKKSGKKCVGCPHGGNCGGDCSSCK